MPIKISRTMSTQHPDNINTPFFSDGEVLGGETEVKEAFYVFSQLGCREQMWDSEGKEVDNQVVEKLLSKYPEFFRKNVLGKDIFLTYRVPNPSVQKKQAKILLETLHSIPRAFDAAGLLGHNIAPIFEVIIPMTTSYEDLNRIKTYYQKIIIGQKDICVGEGNVTVKEWVGDFQPEDINIIPLFEDYDAFFNAPEILKKYLAKKKTEYQRVFLARSDPALNYSSVAAVLMAKVALKNLAELSEKISIDILPILGVGSAPFRGNFQPNNVTNCGEEYPSVHTFTVQSSFKYDHPFRDVANAIDMLNLSHTGPSRPIDDKKAISLIGKIKTEYQKQIYALQDFVHAVSPYIPARRTRKLHVGLFGYSRSVKGIQLPRAINFCASFYSIGLPPEFLGLGILNEKDWEELHDMYIKIEEDLSDAAKFVNIATIKRMPPAVSRGIMKVFDWIDYEENEEYMEISSRIFENVIKGRTATMTEDIKRAAWKRKFLG